MIIRNAKIITLDENDDLIPQPYTWMRFDDQTGYITGLGHATEHLECRDEIIDVGGRWILPGLHDSHLHVQLTGHQLTTLNLFGCNSRERFTKEVRAAVVTASKGHTDTLKYVVITGSNWEQDVLGFLPDRHILDEICEEFAGYKIAILLPRICHHISVVNSVGLELLGINEAFAQKFNADPSSGGRVDVEETTGKPTGILRENAHTDHVDRFLQSQWTAEDIKGHVMKGLNLCASRGVTTVHTCESTGWEVWKDIYTNKQNNHMTDNDHVNIPRAQVSFYFDYFAKNKQKIFRLNPDHSKLHFSCIRIKIFCDGALGPQTAALSHPYANCKCHISLATARGIAIENQETLVEKIKNIYEHGMGVEIHVIGDYAAQFTVDALVSCEELRTSGGLPHPILIHCQLLQTETIKKIAANKFQASVQPQFVPTDCRWLDINLTEEYQQKVCMYPWKTLLEAGIVTGGGSDAPVEDINPLVGMHDAIARPDGRDGVVGKFQPEECVTFAQALQMYTTDAARLVDFCENDGRLRVGGVADFVVLDVAGDQDLVNDVKVLGDAKVYSTYVAGKCIFQKL